MKYISPYVH